MDMKCDQSKGSMVAIDREDQIRYVGDGIFSDWSPSELMAVYKSLVPKTDSNFEVMQLG
jgi:hypothetical protein